MGSNMYPSASASLFSNHKDESLADVPVEQLIENADAFAAVFPGWLRRVFFVHEHDLSLSLQRCFGLCFSQSKSTRL